MDSSSYKLRIRLPDGRSRYCGTGTRDRERYDGMRRWVQSLKRGAARRLDVLEVIVAAGVPLADAYDARADLSAVLALTGVRDIEPYVARWAARNTARSSATYLRQVRGFIPAGKPFPVGRFTASEARKWLRGLEVADPTRNRYKAALSSFAAYLVEEGVLERNPISDVSGWSEGHGRDSFYSEAECQRLLAAVDNPQHAGLIALAMSGCEHQVLERVTVRDVDLHAGTVWADGGKNQWRRRLVKLVFPWALPYVAALVEGREPGARLAAGVAGDRPLLRSIARAAEQVGVSRLTLHDQRHSCAVNMLRAGYRPEVVAHTLGHRDTTLVWQRYGRYTVDERDYVRREASETASAPHAPVKQHEVPRVSNQPAYPGRDSNSYTTRVVEDFESLPLGIQDKGLRRRLLS